MRSIASTAVSSSTTSPCSRARHAEAAIVGVRSGGERDVARHRRPRLVLAQGVLDRDDVRGGRDVREVAELADLLDVVEDLRELLRHALELLVGELEAGEAGDME